MNPFDELIKCRDDFLYFVDKYVQIVHPKLGLIPFKVYDYQIRLKKAYDENQFVIFKKFRQGGFTTFTAIWALWEAMFHTDRKILFISKTDREAVHIGRVIKKAMDYLPDWLKPKLSQENDHTKIFSFTESSISFLSIEATRSRSATHLIIDEAAFIRNMDEHWKALFPVIATSGKVFALSTPNGIGGWFQETYHGALDKKNNFNVIEFDYWEHPDYNDPEWVKQMKVNLGERGFRQEVLGEFLAGDCEVKCRAADKIASDLIYFMCAKNLSEEDVKLLYSAVKKLRTLRD